MVTWSFDYTGVNLSEGFHFVGFHTGIGPDASIFVLIDDDNPASAVDITSIADDTGVQGDYVTSDATLSVTGLLGGDPYAVEVSSDGGATWGAEIGRAHV